MEEGRYLGLDIGTKRIGIAVSDPLYLTAQPVDTIMRQPEKKSIEEIKRLCEKYNVSHIIAGLPVNMDGSFGYQAQDVTKYADLLKQELQIQLIFEDERLTSEDAEKILIEQGKKPSKNKALIDKVAAAIILQQYLDRRR